MPADTFVGHVHLKVSDVPRASAFYRDALGFEEQAQLPSAAFLVRRRLPPSRRAELVAEQRRRERRRTAHRACARSSSTLGDAPALEALERRLADAGADAQTPTERTPTAS